MNNYRRKEIEAVGEGLDMVKAEIDRLAAEEETGDAGTSQDLKANVAKWQKKLDGLKDDLETPRDEEQEYYDNMPEGLQGGDKGSNAEAAISAMEGVIQDLEELVDAEIEDFVSMFHERYDDMNSALQEAAA